MQNLSILRSDGWLAAYDADTQDAILEGGRIRTFTPEETLYRYDEFAEGMFGLISGNAVISIPNDVGSEYPIFQASPGFWIGDLALFTDQRRLISVTAVSDVTAYFIAQPRLARLVQDRPDLLRVFYGLTQRNLALQLQLMANLAIPNSDKRVAAFLLAIDKRNTTPEDWLEVPQDRLAAMVALSVPTVQRVLRRLADRQLVELGYGRLRVRDAARLGEFTAA